MRIVFFIISTVIILSSCDTKSKLKEGTCTVSILPQPKYLKKGTKHLLISSKSKLFTPHSEVYPLLDLFSSEIKEITNIRLKTTHFKNQEADIVFKIDSSLLKEEHVIDVDETVTVTGGSYRALATAKATVLQLIQEDEYGLKLPVIRIKDRPDAAYRGLMIDLARKWHDLNTIKKLIDLAAYYKINYLQLHFTDHQSYTLPSQKYPKLSTAERHYTIEELEELEAYSQLRGVTIIPEIDVPGHSTQFINKYPEIFGIKNSKINSSIINMGKEEVYSALETLIGEVLSVFKSTPYFHIGGDEAIFTGVMEDPDVKKYMAKHKIKQDVHELYRHFINRLNKIVKKHNRQMCVWEGFDSNGKIEIAKDIIVFPFETNRYLPNELIRDGYTVVNVSWKPLYVVNEKKWSPKTIYNWNMWRWENWWDKAPSFKPIQTEKSDLVIGAQMCTWEQTQEVEIPSLRKRLPVFVERIWNTNKKINYKELIQRMEVLDKRFSILIDDNKQDTLLYHFNFKKNN